MIKRLKLKKNLIDMIDLIISFIQKYKMDF